MDHEATVASPFNPVPDLETEKNRLVRTLELARGFSLHFAICQATTARRRWMKAVESSLPEKKIQRLRVQPKAENLLFLLREQIQSPPPDVLFVEGLENLSGNVHDLRLHVFILNLNATRDAFQQVFSGPIVFWVAPITFSALVRGAPDFFSVRSSVVQFPLVPSEHISIHMSSDLHIADRRRLQSSLLQGLSEQQFNVVLEHIPGATSAVPRRVTSAERVEALVSYAEKVGDLGLDALAEAVSTTLTAESAKTVSRSEGIDEVTQSSGEALLPPRNRFFVGREEDLKALRNSLTQTGNTAATQAITGLGGIGKTALAIEYAYRYAKDYPYRFFVNAGSLATLYSDYRTIAELVGCCPPAGASADAVIAAMKQWLNTHEHWLIILDNAYLSGTYAPDDLKAFLPEDPRGHVLITTRARTIPSSLSVTPNPVQSLSTLSPADALQLLRTRVYGGNAPLTGAERQAAIDLAIDLGHLPLALEQAAAYITARQTTFQAYLALWRRESVRHIERARPETGNDRQTVGTTWLISFQELAKAEPSADLLTLASFLAPDAIPEEIVFGAADGLIESIAKFFGSLTDTEANRAHYAELLEPLTRYSLATQDVANFTFSIHPLVQAVRRDSLTGEEKKAWIDWATAILVQAFPQPDFENWERCERLIAHVLTIIAHNGRNHIVSENVAWLCGQAAYYLVSRGRHTEAEPLYKQALETFRTAQSQGHPSVATSLNNLAALYQRQARFTEAEALFREALAIRQVALSAEHPDVATSLNNLAALLQATNRLSEAEPYSRRHLEIFVQFTRTTGHPHPHLEAAVKNYGSLLMQMGRTREEAIAILRDIAPELFG